MIYTEPCAPLSKTISSAETRRSEFEFPGAHDFFSISLSWANVPEPPRLRQIFHGWLMPNRLRVKAHEIQDVGRHVDPHRKTKTLGAFKSNRMVVRPGSFRQKPRKLFSLFRRDFIGKQFAYAFPQLHNRFLGLIGVNERLVVDVPDRFFRHGLQDRCRGVLAKLRIDGP